MPRYKVGDDIYNLPDDKIEEFLIKFPDAVLVGEDTTVVEEDPLVSALEPIQQPDQVETDQQDLTSTLEPPLVEQGTTGRAQVQKPADLLINEEKEKSKTPRRKDEIFKYNERLTSAVKGEGEFENWLDLTPIERLNAYEEHNSPGQDLVYWNKETQKPTPTPGAIELYEKYLPIDYVDYSDSEQFETATMDVVTNAVNNDPAILHNIKQRFILEKDNINAYTRDLQKTIGEDTSKVLNERVDEMNEKLDEYINKTVYEPFFKSKFYSNRLEEIGEVTENVMATENKAYFRREDVFLSSKYNNPLFESIYSGMTQMVTKWKEGELSRFQGKIATIDQQIKGGETEDPNAITFYHKPNLQGRMTVAEKLEDLKREKSEIEEKVKRKVAKVDKLKMESIKFNKADFGDSWRDIGVTDIIQTVGEALPQMTAVMAGTLLKSPALTSLGLVSIFGQEYGGNYMEAIEQGLRNDNIEPTKENIEKAINQGKYAKPGEAAGAAGIQTALERFGAVQLIRRFSKGLGWTGSAKDFLTSIYNTEMKQIAKSVGKAGIRAGEGGAIEFLTEGGQTVISQVVKATQLEKPITTYLDTKEIKHSMIAGGIVGVVLPGGASVASQTVTELRNTAREVATRFDLRGGGFKEANEFFIAAEQNIKNKFLRKDARGNYYNMTKEQMNSELQHLSSMRNAGLKIPSNYTVKAKQAIFDLMMERNQLNIEITQTDPALVEPEMERIKKLDMGIALIGAGQKARIAGEKATEEEIEKATKAGERIGKKTIVLTGDEFFKKFGSAEEAAKDIAGVQYLNKDVMLTAAIQNGGFIAAGMHEVLHNVVDTEITAELGKDFLNILKTNNKEAYDGVIKRLEDRGYTDAELKKSPSEYVTQFFSYIIENDIKYEQLDKNFIQKLMDWFAKRFGVVFGDNDIGFKDGKDLYNFILDYSEDSKKSGKLSGRSIELAKKGEGVKGKKVKSKAEKEVSIDELAKQYKNDPTDVNIDIESLLTQYQKLGKDALKTWAAKRNVPYKFDVKEVEALLGKEFESIMKNYKPIDPKTGKSQKLSTYMGNVIGRRIGPGIVEEYTRKTKQVNPEKLPDTQTVKQKELDLAPKKSEKTPTLIDPRDFNNVKNNKKQIDEAVKIKKEQVALANFKYISDNFGAKVASIIYNIPESKIKDATKNLTYARKIVNGIPESSEAGSIQSDFAQVDEAGRFLKLLPPYNVSTSEARINKQGETIPVSKDVKGRSLGLSNVILNYFYEDYVDPTGNITTPKGRSLGSTSQVNVKRLKPKFRDNISIETIKQFQKDMGITKPGQLNIYDRTIGQFLKGIAKLKGAITANTIIDKQIEKMDLKTAKGKKQVKADTRAGRSDIQFSRKFANDSKNIEDGDLLRKYKAGKGKTLLGQQKYKRVIINGEKKKVLNPNFDATKEKNDKATYTEGLTNVLMPEFPRNMLTYGGKNYQLFLKTKTYTSFYTKEEIRKIFDNKDQAFGKPFTKIVKGKKVPLTNEDFRLLSIPYNKMFPQGEKSMLEAIANGSLNKFNYIARIVHRQMWMRFDKLIKRDPKNVRIIASFLGGVSNITNHYHKQGAQITAYTKGFKAGKENVEWEHARPATDTYRALLNASLNGTKARGKKPKVNFKAAYDEIIKNFNVIALAKDDNTKLTDAGLTQKMPPGETNWIKRYFNKLVAVIKGGINPRSIIWIPTGKTLFEQFKINTDGTKATAKEIETYKKIIKQSKLAANKNAKVFYPKLSKGKSVEDQVKVLENYDKAMVFSRSLKTPEKGISVFDFDDTLAKTNSKVLYTLPNGKKGKLSATEFAVKSRALEDAGAIFDFSQFSKVVEGKKGPLADLAIKRQGKFGSKDIFIVTARPQESMVAIHDFLKGIGLNIPLENITGLEDGSPIAKANWVAEKAAKGYNNFYFADDVWGNVKAVKEILDQIDVKSEVQHVKFSKAKKLNEEFNIIIEKKTGIGRNKQYSPARAKTIGASKGKFNFMIPNSAEDFVGLMYQLLGKGKEGDAQMAWLKKNLLAPFNRAEATITKDKISVSNDFVELKKQFKGIPKTLKKEALDGFTYENALRVYIWNVQGQEIPGLAKKDIKELTEFIDNNQDLKTFANELVKILKGKEYPPPTETWLSGTLTTDMIGGINTINRAEYLQEWQENVDIIFSPQNMIKLEAAYGTSYVVALKNILKRMKTGTNKSNSGNKQVDDIMNWINGSVGAIMFLNTRSAVLQTISAVNYINWTDNNVLAAGKAFANQPQFWKDFIRLFNSDFLVSRRRGLKINVTESEIADAAQSGSVTGVISMLLKKGFILTQIADSFAIASGGASFYRNRINTYIKDGMSKTEAETQAFLDFYEISEEAQQSSRTDRISMQQASAAGRIILAFGNTPMQYARLIKKASMDLVNGRGDWKTNVSKIIYYGVIQNIIFNAVQNALFVMLFDDDDDDIPQDKAIRTANGMMDSLLRGLGIGGAAVATVKNIILKIYQESEKKRPDYESAALEILKLSPPISSKVSKLRSAGRTMSWDAKEIKEKGFSLDNPAYLAGAQILSAGLNIPLDRVIKKSNNIADAISDESEYWQKIALLGGWAMWELEIKKKEDKTKNTGREILKREVLTREILKR